MLHQDRRDPHAVVVERVDLDGLHQRCGRGDRCPAGDDTEIDVGPIVVVGNADLVHEDVGGEVAAAFVGDAHVDVVCEGLEQLLCQQPNARRRRVGKEHRHDSIRRKRRDRQPGLTRAEHVDPLGRPEPQQQIDVVDHVVAVQVGEEDRADGAATLRPSLGMHRDSRPPRLPVDSLAAVDEVGVIADHDRVGIARPRRLGVRRPGSTQQDQAFMCIRPQRWRAVTHGRCTQRGAP